MSKTIEEEIAEILHKEYEFEFTVPVPSDRAKAVAHKILCEIECNVRSKYEVN